MALQVSFGVSTWLWTSPFNTAAAQELFPRIAGMGYDAVEIAVEDVAQIDAQQVKALLQANGLKALVCGAFGATRDLTHENPSVQANCLQYIEDCLNLCAAWNTGFFAGPMYSAVGKARMLPPDGRKREWERAVINLQKVCGLAAARGVQIALEPLNRFESDLVNRAADVMRLIRDISHPAAKVVLDGFHMSIEEPDVEQAIRETGDHLIHVQVSENYRGIPGTGQARWDALYRGLQAVNYQGAVSIESFTPDNKELAAAVCIWQPLAVSQDAFAREGLAFLRSWSQQATPPAP